MPFLNCRFREWQEQSLEVICDSEKEGGRGEVDESSFENNGQLKIVVEQFKFSDEWSCWRRWINNKKVKDMFQLVLYKEQEYHFWVVSAIRIY